MLYVDCIIKQAIAKPFFASYVLCQNFADDLKKIHDSCGSFSAYISEKEEKNNLITYSAFSFIDKNTRLVRREYFFAFKYFSSSCITLMKFLIRSHMSYCWEYLNRELS